jgi:sphingolipid delta-4 desaturase
MFNVGYHFEHHDLFKVSWKYLPRVKEIAPEFYQELHVHPSYLRVIKNFLFDPKMTLNRRFVRS